MPDNNDLRQISGFTPVFNGGSFGIVGQIDSYGSFAIMANRQAQLAAAFALAAAEATSLGNFSAAASLAAAADFHSRQTSFAAAAAAATPFGGFSF